MALGAALGTALSMGASFLSGVLGRSDAKKQAKKEEAAIRAANEQATADAQQMNKEIRQRADTAAKVPVQTQRESHERTSMSQSTAGGVDMDAFMHAAEDYGFNPLTFLRSGALSLFAKTSTMGQTSVDTFDFTCTTGEHAMDAALSGTYLPQLSPVIAQTRVPGMGEVLGGAITAGANHFLNDLSQQQNNDFQMKLLDKQLGARASGTAPSSRQAQSFYTPKTGLYGSYTQATPVKVGSSMKAPAGGKIVGGMEAEPLYVPYVDNSEAGGGKVIWGVNPKIADSEQYAGAGLMTAGNKYKFLLSNKPLAKATATWKPPSSGLNRSTIQYLSKPSVPVRRKPNPAFKTRLPGRT